MLRLLATVAVSACLLAPIFLTGGLQPAAAQSDAASPGEQTIVDHVFQSCVKDGKLGTPGGELELNCQCEARATLSVLTAEARAALADGTFFTTYQGAKFTVDQEGYSRVIIKSCPGVRPILKRQICDPAPDSSGCTKLKQALDQAE